MIVDRELFDALDSQPRLPLADLPTPLHFAQRLSAELGAEVWIKRDDLTGLAMGGNKVRKLEYLFGRARAERQVDTVVTVGGVQSNHARSTAVAARVAGWDCHLVLGGPMPTSPTGNLTIANAVGARFHFVDTASWAALEQEALAVCDELLAEGRHPLFIPMGGSTATGALGYVAAYLELLEQLRDAGVDAESVVHATSTGGTQAGLDFAHRVLQAGPPVIGVAVAKDAAELTQTVTRLQEELAVLLGVEADPGTAMILDQYRGPGYGIPTHGGQSAFARLAATEGILTDHVYSAKALAAVVDRATRTVGGPIVFWHTGGVPSTFSDVAPAAFWSPLATRTQRLQPA
jgi:D-cysteine desulfhydrase family pyridoxal phosphate-dependent enzyme